MCACTATFVCSRCADTPQDWRWHLDDDPKTVEEERAEAARGVPDFARPWKDAA